MEKDKFKIAFTETILNTFPEILKQDVEKVIEILSFDKDYLFSPDSQTIYIDNEEIGVTPIELRLYKTKSLRISYRQN